MKEGILMEFHLLYLVQVLDCQYENDRKASPKMKPTETKAEKKVNVLFVK